MKVIRNGNKKTVCRADATQKSVEIKQKGFKTVITFLEDNKMKVINSEEKSQENRIKYQQNRKTGMEGIFEYFMPVFYVRKL